MVLDSLISLLGLQLSPGIEKFWRVMIILVLAVAAYKIVIRNVERAFLKRVSGGNLSNVRVFINVLNYVFITFLIIFLIFAYAGSLTSIGIGAGLFTAALGWALQKPITGIAAWVMIVTKRPFNIGDRVIIGGVKGDVDDITITHIYLKECGGTVEGEEESGRIIMIPNSLLFEQDIINYTLKDPYILDEVITMITYESNIDDAEKISLAIAKKRTQDVLHLVAVKPHIRLMFQASGINVKLRYYVKAMRRNKVATDITRDIFKEFGKTKKVEIAYPHIQLVKK